MSLRLVFKYLLFVFLLLFNAFYVSAEVVFKPSVGVAFGDYQDANYTEIRGGGILHLVELPLAFQLQAFRRLARSTEDFSGLDFDFKLKRLFKVANDYLVGTYFGPGYRLVSNDFDAPTIDFALAVSRSDSFGLQIGYKIILLDWSSKDYENDNLFYLNVQF